MISAFAVGIPVKNKWYFPASAPVMEAVVIVTCFPVPTFLLSKSIVKPVSVTISPVLTSSNVRLFARNVALVFPS